MTSTQFQEIEHKFIVGKDFDLAGFRSRMEEMQPHKTTVLTVRDVYYWSPHHPAIIFRHRFDRELQHLSVKSLQKDTEVRLEVNLDLGQHRGDQQAAVEAFLDALTFDWRGEITKDIEVFYYPDCEIVYYRGSRAGGKSVACVEFEARHPNSVAEALQILRRYEHRTGFDTQQRTSKTLVELLFPEVEIVRGSSGEAP